MLKNYFKIRFCQQKTITKMSGIKIIDYVCFMKLKRHQTSEHFQNFAITGVLSVHFFLCKLTIFIFVLQMLV